MSEMDEIVKEFLVESCEGLDTLDRNLVALEQQPGDKELMGGIFRAIHTIKGTSGFLAFGRLESVAHAGESLLAELRDGRKALTPEITTALLELVDALRAILTTIESTGTDGTTDFAGLIGVLAALQAGTTPATAVAVMPKTGEGVAPVKARRKRRPAAGLTAMRTPSPATPDADGPGIMEAATWSLPPMSEASQVRGSHAPEQNIRVDVSLLDKLMNLVGELVLARNQLLQFSATTQGAGVVATSQRLNLITTELQEGVMKTRMQPIGNIWAKFPRVVRDLALACSKQVRIEMEGQETELDKTIIEAIKDPLTHIIRNAVDHGLESPAQRIAAGKAAEGRLTLRAFHEGGQVNIEIADDGAGVHAERVKAKALHKGLYTSEQLARMSERELVALIFAPGFSTAERVSNISGRGVGLDVVKTNIEKIGGTVEVHTVVGQGTSLRIRIPLTLAIIPALNVSSGGERFAIPQVSLLELVRLESTTTNRIEMVHGTPVHRLRGRLLPLVSLAHVLEIEPDFHGPPGEPRHIVNIVVLEADGLAFGLVVDEIHDTEEIVVKPLGKMLKGIGAFAGATIMGDGRVALILDVVGLAQKAGVVSSGGRQSEATGRVEVPGAEAGERHTLLLFQLGLNRRMALPLDMVARLEEFPRSAVERTGPHQLVQYQGRLLPLLRLAELLGERGAGEERDPVPVVVYQHEGRELGLIVEHILDIVEEDVTIHLRQGQGDIRGTAVIQGRVTDLLDMRAVIDRAAVLQFVSARSDESQLAGV